MSGKEPSRAAAPGGPLPYSETIGHELDHEIWFLRSERPDLGEPRLRTLYLRAELALLEEAGPQSGHVRKAGEVLVTDEGTTLFLPNERGGPEIRDVLAWINRTVPPRERRGAPRGWRGKGPLLEAGARAWREVARERPNRRPTLEAVALELGYWGRSSLDRALERAGLTLDDFEDLAHRIDE